MRILDTGVHGLVVVRMRGSIHAGKMEALDETPAVSMERSNLRDPDLDLTVLPPSSLDEQPGRGRGTHEGNPLDHLEVGSSKVGDTPTMGCLVAFLELSGERSGFSKSGWWCNTDTTELAVSGIAVPMVLNRFKLSGISNRRKDGYQANKI